MNVISVSKARPHVSSSKDASILARYSVMVNMKLCLETVTGETESIESVALQSQDDSLFTAVREQHEHEER